MCSKMSVCNARRHRTLTYCIHNIHIHNIQYIQSIQSIQSTQSIQSIQSILLHDNTFYTNIPSERDCRPPTASKAGAHTSLRTRCAPTRRCCPLRQPPPYSVAALPCVCVCVCLCVCARDTHSEYTRPPPPPLPQPPSHTHTSTCCHHHRQKALEENRQRWDGKPRLCRRGPIVGRIEVVNSA